MRAEELRVGNLVFDGITNEKVSSSMLHYGWRNENYKGIPLTEEWLLKFGFDKDIFTCGYKADIVKGILYLDYGEIELTEVKHVHQLQNLYFALTGEELKIQENA